MLTAETASKLNAAYVHRLPEIKDVEKYQVSVLN
jgi:hypothetical protein